MTGAGREPEWDWAAAGPLFAASPTGPRARATPWTVQCEGRQEPGGRGAQLAGSTDLTELFICCKVIIKCFLLFVTPGTVCPSPGSCLPAMVIKSFSAVGLWSAECTLGQPGHLRGSHHTAQPRYCHSLLSPTQPGPSEQVGGASVLPGTRKERPADCCGPRQGDTPGHCPPKC